MYSTSFFLSFKWKHDADYEKPLFTGKATNSICLLTQGCNVLYSKAMKTW